jgi:hypothetical protein
MLLVTGIGFRQRLREGPMRVFKLVGLVWLVAAIWALIDLVFGCN